MKPVRPIRIEGDVAFVPLTKGYEAIIDAADADVVSQFNWHVKILPTSRTVYARRNNGRNKTLALHRQIAPPPEGFEVDHINGDGLDNRRANLRFATSSQNKFNRGARADNKSGLKGVCLHKHSGLWIAQIKSNNTRKHLGYFKTPEQAFTAYCRAAGELHGEFLRVC